MSAPGTKRPTGRNRAHFVEQGRLAWVHSFDEYPQPPRGSWQLQAFREGFDKAYEAERPSLDIDAQAEADERAA